jgi:ubiquinone/menaquinone biosynthesis C-methylase UbiE
MAQPTAEQIKDVNVRYHDVAAVDYDAKWGIDYEELGRTQVLAKLRKALGERPAGYGRGLEIGAGTGYFGLNLRRAGVIDALVATDISQGMLEALETSAGRLGLEVETARCEASELPFEDGSFEIVFGHAVLHHLPDLEGAFREFRRVLAPGGTLVFCGEPSRQGDRIAAIPKRAALAAAPTWRRLLGARERPPEGSNGHGPVADDHHLEQFVDVHAFTPSDLASHARAAGFERVRVRGEELTASWFGWFNRTFESTADPRDIPWLWRQYAYRGYLALQALDRRLLEPRLPPAIFYNLLVSARAPRCR